MMNLKFQLFEKKTINQENLKFNYTPKINSYLVITRIEQACKYSWFKYSPTLSKQNEKIRTTNQSIKS